MPEGVGGIEAGEAAGVGDTSAREGLSGARNTPAARTRTMTAATAAASASIAATRCARAPLLGLRPRATSSPSSARGSLRALVVSPRTRYRSVYGFLARRDTWRRQPKHRAMAEPMSAYAQVLRGARPSISV